MSAALDIGIGRYILGLQSRNWFIAVIAIILEQLFELLFNRFVGVLLAKILSFILVLILYVIFWYFTEVMT